MKSRLLNQIKDAYDWDHHPQNGAKMAIRLKFGKAKTVESIYLVFQRFSYHLS